MNDNIPPPPTGRSYLTPAKRAELLRRLKEMEENPDIGVPWEEIKESLFEQYRRTSKDNPP